MEAATEMEEKYIASLSDKERLTMRIAREQLGSSFSLAKSNGMAAWLQAQPALAPAPAPPTATSPTTRPAPTA
jgi:hypothetical protein